MAKKTVQRDPLGRLESEFEEEENEDAILQDGQRLRVPLYMRDGVTPQSAADARPSGAKQLRSIRRWSSMAATTRLAMHRPGFRYLADNNQRAINDAAKAEAYADVERVTPMPGGARPTGPNCAIRKATPAPCAVRSTLTTSAPRAPCRQAAMANWSACRTTRSRTRGVRMRRP